MLPLESPSERIETRILSESRRVLARRWTIRRLAPLAAAASIALVVASWLAFRGSPVDRSGGTQVPVVAESPWYDDGTGELAMLDQRLERAWGVDAGFATASDADSTFPPSWESSADLLLAADSIGGRIDSLKQDVTLLALSNSIF